MCDLVLFPSLPSFGEGFGLPWSEAMAAGVPVVASDAGPLPEVVADGESGLVVAAGDDQAWGQAILALASDHSLRLHLGDGARARACLDSSVGDMADRTVAVYREGSPSSGPCGHCRSGGRVSSLAVGCWRRPSRGEEMAFAPVRLFAPLGAKCTASKRVEGDVPDPPGVSIEVPSSQPEILTIWSVSEIVATDPTVTSAAPAPRARVRLLARCSRPAYGSYWIDGLRSVGTIQLHPLPAQLLPSSIAFEFADRKFVIDAVGQAHRQRMVVEMVRCLRKGEPLARYASINKVIPMGPGFATKTWGIVSMASA